MRKKRGQDQPARRIGLYGGSFNPIHYAHLVLAEQAREALGLDRVIFVPAKSPPHKALVHLAPASERLRMVRLAVADHPGFRVSDIELRRKGPSYTIDTVKAFRRRFGRQTKIFFLIGADTVGELPTWKSVRELATLCNIVPLNRPGARKATLRMLSPTLGVDAARGILSATLSMPNLDISASDIRRRVSEGQSIRYLVPAAVEALIRRKNLYC